ncbi:TVP38/TMEM64 family protein [Halalkalibacter urbisdiaboli]|uniref:TVP38/TMEM64 family protein n=1 Tax=Halalkalibacter urbisdiaboli TaxID=1960589 RepID=UPI000B44BBBF|nr:VTT domain-containing protein [Halalkalibacter urbisdiaboli]
MEELLERSLRIIEEAGWLGPLFFIILHVFRQVLFIPVLVICLIGGYLFGTLYGSIYSILGLTAVSLVFYGMIHMFASFRNKISQLKTRFLKEKHDLTLAQMMIMRLMPFIHFHLVSLYLIETSKGIKDYIKKSVLVSIPPAIAYTAFGDMIHELPLAGTVIFASFLTILFILFRKRESKISWNDFFGTKNTKKPSLKKM